MKCEVANCVSAGSGAKNILFYKFPRDSLMSKRWAASINRPNLVSKEKKFVCSLHFPSKSFIVSGNSICLTEDAVPTIIKKDGNYNSCPYLGILKRYVSGPDNSFVCREEVKNSATSDSSVTSENPTPIRIRKNSNKIIARVKDFSSPLPLDSLELPANECSMGESKPYRSKRFRKHILKRLELSTGKKARLVVRPKAYVLKPDGTYFETEMKTDIPDEDSITPLILVENDHSVNRLCSLDITRIETDLSTFEVENSIEKNSGKSRPISNALNSGDGDKNSVDLNNKMINVRGETLSRLYDAYLKNKTLEMKLRSLKTRYNEQQKKMRLANQSLRRAKRRIELYKIPEHQQSAEERIDESDS